MLPLCLNYFWAARGSAIHSLRRACEQGSRRRPAASCGDLAACGREGAMPRMTNQRTRKQAQQRRTSMLFHLGPPQSRPKTGA
eukprot:15479798-Alexandrium_andersonii.AAC.1